MPLGSKDSVVTTGIAAISSLISPTSSITAPTGLIATGGLIAAGCSRVFHHVGLTTGRVITRHHFTPLPMPQDVIDRLDRLGRKARAPIGLVFKDRYATDDDDSTYVPEVSLFLPGLIGP